LMLFESVNVSRRRLTRGAQRPVDKRLRSPASSKWL
jgi:hypothetical protein